MVWRIGFLAYGSGMTRRDPTTGRFVKGVTDLKPLTDSAIYDMAMGMLKNGIFVATTESELSTSFMLLIGLMAAEQIPQNAFTMAGRMTNRIQMAINGLPIFHTGQWLTQQDYLAVLGEFHRLKDLLEAAEPGVS